MALAAILITGYSGIVMSRYVFKLLPIQGGLATARKLHLAGSYWAFVLMSVYLGMHWSMLIAKCGKEKWKKPVILWGMRIAATVLAGVGAYFLVKTEVFKNMFLLNEFAFLDYETVGIFIILQNLVMMSTWIFIGHYLTKAMIKMTRKGSSYEYRSFTGKPE